MIDAHEDDFIAQVHVLDSSKETTTGDGHSLFNVVGGIKGRTNAVFVTVSKWRIFHFCSILFALYIDINPHAHTKGKERETERETEREMASVTTAAPTDDVEASSSTKKITNHALFPFAIVSISYILFTITDGAVRMIVLLHAYGKSFTAMEIAVMFSLYELMGVATNLVAGIMGARWGIRATLLTGLSLQIGGLGMLFAWTDAWSKMEAIAYVTGAQALCGIAKDLTKLGGKTVTKLVTPDEKQNRLFVLVSGLTGLKNSFKGVGYFLGAWLLTMSYETSLIVMIVLIAIAFPFGFFGLRKDLGRVGKENVTLKKALTQNRNTKYLSLSRVFLFGSRDLWFEIPLPFFLRDATEGMGWSRSAVGAMLAGYIIVYGQLQSWTPQLVLKPLKQSPPNKRVAVLWNVLLVLCPLFLGACVSTDMFDSKNKEKYEKARTVLIILGIALFAFLFAVNSAIHSYLVVKYAEGNKLSMSVGFYYMANAFGRLLGTILSGFIYTAFKDDAKTGFAVCFWASCASVLLSAFFETYLDDDGEVVDGGGAKS